MIKKILIAVAILFVLVVGGLYVVKNKLDVIVHYAIEKYGPEVTGVTVKVRDVELDATDGRGALKGVEIGSPKGFNAPRTAKLGEIRVRMDPSTIRDGVIVVHEVIVEAPEIHYERGNAGTNLDAIQKNIEGYLRSSGTPSGNQPAGAQAPGRRYAIEKLAIRNARVTMTNPGLKGQGVTFTLPDIEMANLGRKPDGITAAQAANLVTGALVAKIAQRLLTNLDLLREGGTKGAVEALKNLVR
ncbi:hypothetical protein BWI17_10385 [Betaproteobacteria bacterium GR16-43]|nr:hypothetical protein BWI17_10385 [Betaproteobacteria bacterium GR16-43]